MVGFNGLVWSEVLKDSVVGESTWYCERLFQSVMDLGMRLYLYASKCGRACFRVMLWFFLVLVVENDGA